MDNFTDNFTPEVAVQFTIAIVMAAVGVAVIGTIVSIVGVGAQIFNAIEFGAAILRLASILAFGAIAIGIGALAIAILKKE